MTRPKREKWQQVPSPTPAEIKRRAAKIRAKWPPGEAKRRWQLARRIRWELPILPTTSNWIDDVGEQIIDHFPPPKETRHRREGP